MVKKTAYIETSIPSAFVDQRDDLTSRFQREQTRFWWKYAKTKLEIYCSEAVVDELGRQAFPGQQSALRFAKKLSFLPITDDVLGVAEIYQRHLVMPRGSMGDAVHLAIACVHEVDYLVTWNCRHLANANKIQHIQVINMRLGLLTPLMVTPPMLAEEA